MLSDIGEMNDRIQHLLLQPPPLPFNILAACKFSYDDDFMLIK